MLQSFPHAGGQGPGSDGLSRRRRPRQHDDLRGRERRQPPCDVCSRQIATHHPAERGDAETGPNRGGEGKTASADEGFPRFVDWFRRYHGMG